MYLTRNQANRKVPRVRIPPSPPAKSLILNVFWFFFRTEVSRSILLKLVVFFPILPKVARDTVDYRAWALASFLDKRAESSARATP